MTDSFKHHFQDVLPQKASDVSGVVKNRGAAVVSGPHVPVGGVVNMSETAHTSSTLWWMTYWLTASSSAESPSSSLSTSTGRRSHGMSVAMPSNRSTSLTASVTAVTPSALGIFTSTPSVWAYEHRRQFTHTRLLMIQLVTSQRTMTYCLNEEPNHWSWFPAVQGHPRTVQKHHNILPCAFVTRLLDPLMWSYQQGLYKVPASLPGSLQQLRLQRHFGPWHPPQNLFPQLRRALVERHPSAAVTRCHICSGYQQQWGHQLTTRTENKQLNFNTAAAAHTYLSRVFTAGFDERCRLLLFLSDLVSISDGELQFLRPLRQDAFILFLLLYSQHLNTPFPLGLHSALQPLRAQQHAEEVRIFFS